LKDKIIAFCFDCEKSVYLASFFTFFFKKDNFDNYKIVEGLMRAITRC